MSDRSLNIPLATIFSLVALLASVQTVAAESVVWTKQETTNLCSNSKQWECATAIQTPTISITYHAEVLQDGTGTKISCGSTIPKGTKVLLRFIPSQYTDVYWFAPGYSFDSPYGDWVSGGAKPQVDMCNLDKYYTPFTS